MTTFIKTLTDEHVVILTLLKKAKAPKLNPKVRTSYIHTIKNILTDHLTIEDEKLYPKLREMASSKNNALKVVEEFTLGLDKIGNIITNFFDNYEKSDDIMNNSDLSKIINLLELRINKEEKVLYTMYDKLIEMTNIENLL